MYASYFFDTGIEIGSRALASIAIKQLVVTITITVSGIVVVYIGYIWVSIHIVNIIIITHITHIGYIGCITHVAIIIVYGITIEHGHIHISIRISIIIG